jgi:hypothetical protein
VRVAHYVAQNGFAGQIVIHSVNEQGAAEMKRWLPKAELHPFGSFEIDRRTGDSRSELYSCCEHQARTAVDRPV